MVPDLGIRLLVSGCSPPRLDQDVIDLVHGLRKKDVEALVRNRLKAVFKKATGSGYQAFAPA